MLRGPEPGTRHARKDGWGAAGGWAAVGGSRRRNRRDGSPNADVHAWAGSRHLQPGYPVDRGRNPGGPFRPLLRMGSVPPVSYGVDRRASWNFESSLSRSLRCRLRRHARMIETTGGMTAATVAITSVESPGGKRRNAMPTRMGGARKARTIDAMPRRG